MRILAAVAILFFGVSSASLASAQEAAVVADVASPPPPPPASATPPPAPPVMIAVLSTGHVDAELVTAVQASLALGVRSLAGGRPVLALAQPEMRDRLAACADATCLGTFLGEAGAIGAVIARLSRRSTRGETAMTLDMIDPVSGASRLAQITLSLADAATAPAALAPLIEQLRPSMFSPPPPPPTLMVTVNVDGATIRVDDEVAGESPIALLHLAAGHHVVMITRTGYTGTQRALDLEAGDQERLDIVLTAAEPMVARADGTMVPVSEAPPWYEQWYVWLGIGGGVLVVTGVIIGVVIATTPTTQPDPMGIALPAIHF